ncbi:MAG: GNAT family N-acetyltransferase [Spirochaetes bacterium]|nr:GNAT family N-acetyltransferase [Spirochaetota bacterium]
MYYQRNSKTINYLTKIIDRDKNNIIRNLYENNCTNVYLLYNIYKHLNKINCLYKIDLSFFLAYNFQTKEFFVFFKDNDFINIITKEIIEEYLTKFSNIRYISGDSLSLNLFLTKFNFLKKDIIFDEDYFTYKFELNEKSIINLSKNLSNILVKNSINYEDIKFIVPFDYKSIINLVKLQEGYLIEEMRFSSEKINKIAKEKISNIFKNFKIFYITYNNYPVAKCEWNAYTEDIFQIGGVYTDKFFRNKGFASVLLIEMLKYCYYNLNYKFANLFVRKDNVKAINLYEKVGFERNLSLLRWIILKN